MQTQASTEALDRLREINDCWKAVSDLLCPVQERDDLHVVSRSAFSTLTHLLACEGERR